MWKNLTLCIKSESATKLTVVTIAFVGCFGLVTNLMRSTMSASNDVRNVSAPGTLYHLPGQNDRFINKAFQSSDLDSNASYIYAVVVSPDYIDPYNIPESNNEYNYENYEYAFNNARDSGSFMSSLHWFLSLLNIVILVGEFTSLAFLLNHY